jgi:hypothetical protein
MIDTRIGAIWWAVLSCCVLILSSSVAAPTPDEKPKSDTTAKAKAPAAKKAQTVQLLFVQNADGLSSGDGKITLRGVEAMTVCFSDRPMRLAGHMLTENFVPMWSQGQDSFLKDPPNATLSILQGKDVTSTVVTLRNPQLSGHDLTYDVTLLEGTLPPSAGPCSLFIDIIGCPLTPMSFAGAARRGAFRGAYYGGGYYGPALYDSSGSVQGPRGSAAWSNGSGTATGWRGNTVTWHRD